MDWRNFPPLSALRAFAAFAETGSVQAAGAALNVSHAAISQQLRNLEDLTGLSLVDRSERQARLTDHGAEFSEALLSGFGQMETALASLTNTEQDRPIQVSTTPSFAANWLVPRLASLRESHPDLNVIVDASPALRAFDDSDVDVAIRFGLGGWTGLEARMLLPTRRVVVATPDFLKKGRPARLEDLSNYPILQEQGTSETSNWLKQLGVENVGRAGSMTLPGGTTLDAARAGHGVFVTASPWVEADLAAGRLEEIFAERRDGMGYYLVCRKGPKRAAVQNFLSWAQQRAALEKKGAPSTQDLT